jgi:FixJ family two-component response regulator
MNSLLKKPVHIFIVDDEVEIRDSLERFFSYQGCRVSTYEDAQSYLDQLDQTQVGCLVSDIDMQDMSGLELQRHLNDINCVRPTIFMTGHASINIAIEAMKLGAFDFIEKPFDPDHLLQRIKVAIDSNREKIELINRYYTLTKKEREVFRCVVKGEKNKEMAESLYISMPTIEAHRSRVMRKMQAASLPDLVKMSVILSK